MKFYIGGVEIEKVKEFKYLGRVLSDNDNDTKCIIDNIRKARQQWNCIARFLKREGASARIMAKFYITIVQAVLLYGADSWAITKRDLHRLQCFHKRALRYMSGSHIRKVDNNTWTYPDHEGLLHKCGLSSIEAYLERRRSTLWSFLENYRGELLRQAQRCGKHCKDTKKVLWWKQSNFSTLF